MCIRYLSRCLWLSPKKKIFQIQVIMLVVSGIFCSSKSPLTRRTILPDTISCLCASIIWNSPSMSSLALKDAISSVVSYCSSIDGMYHHFSIVLLSNVMNFDIFYYVSDPRINLRKIITYAKVIFLFSLFIFAYFVSTLRKNSYIPCALLVGQL